MIDPCKPSPRGPWLSVLVISAVLFATIVLFQRVDPVSVPPAPVAAVPDSQPNLTSLPAEVPPTTEELVESLATLDTFGVGYDPDTDSWNCRFFLGSDTPADFDVDDYPELPQFAAPMQALVSHGVEALPALLAHIDDSTATSVGATVIWEPEERFPERPDKDRRWLAALLELVTEFDNRCEHSEYWFSDGEYIDQHWVTIGDLCYVAIGQIVNRDHQIFITGGSNSGRIMSPTANRDLAESLRVEWTGLTIEQHRELLVNEALHSRQGFEDNPRTVNAVKRLCYYYPKTGERILQHLLSRNLCDEGVAFQFAFKVLLREQDPLERKSLFERHQSVEGESQALGAVMALAEQLDSVQERIDEAEAAVRIGSGLSSNGKPLPSEEQYAERDHVLTVYQESVELIGGTDRLTTVAGFWEQDELIRATLSFQSPVVDELTRRIAAQARSFDSASTAWLIEACQLRASRYSGGGESHE